MKAKVIVRKIDNLGRVVIPKEIRCTMIIREVKISVTDNIDEACAFHECNALHFQTNWI